MNLSHPLASPLYFEQYMDLYSSYMSSCEDRLDTYDGV